MQQLSWHFFLISIIPIKCFNHILFSSTHNSTFLDIDSIVSPMSVLKNSFRTVDGGFCRTGGTGLADPVPARPIICPPTSIFYIALKVQGCVLLRNLGFRGYLLYKLKSRLSVCPSALCDAHISVVYASIEAGFAQNEGCVITIASLFLKVSTNFQLLTAVHKHTV